MKKRFLSALMLVVFVIVSLAVVPASAATFTDIENDASTLEAVTVLNKLGVINGYDDGTFKPTNNVTRAEFTAMLLRTRGLGSLGSTSLENPPFPDVTDPSVSWAIGNIRTARDMGIINGYDDGTFKPNNTVTYEEAIKMIVCALGYGEMGVTTEGSAWYAKYLAAATQLKFLDGAGGQIGTPATRATIAKMLYNCLEVKIAESNEITDKTILEADLGLTKNTGFIASNPEISLSEPETNLRSDEIQITAPDEYGHMETLTYKVDNVEEYADMLGAQITFYYSNDRGAATRTLVMANVERSVTIEIAADDIETDECTEDKISYYASENASRLSTISIDADSIVVYNGQLYGASAEESTFEIYCDEMDEAAFPLIGSMKFLDRDADKKYDIVFVDSYDAYIVSSVTASTKTIVDNNLRKGLSDNKIVLDTEDLSKKVKIVDDSGKEVAFSTIKKGSVVCVKASNPANGGEQVVTAVVCNDTVSGSVKGVNSDDTIKIDSKTYSFSALAPWVNPIRGAEEVMTQPQMGDSGKFYLDLNGNIIGYDKTEVTSNQQYGYLMSVKQDNDGLDEILVFRIMTQTGTKTSYYAYDKTKVNGDSFSNYDDLLEALEETANPSGRTYPEETENNDVSQLIKFSTKSHKGQVVVDEIITVTEDTMGGGATVSAETLNFFAPDGDWDVSDEYTYDSTSKTLTGDAGKIYISSATIIRVPNDRSDVDSYKKITTSNIGDEDELQVEFYDVSTSNSAKIVLVYNGASNAGEVDANSPVMFITEISMDQDPEDSGETRYHLTGIVNGSEVDYWGSTESEDVLETLGEGDVVRLGTDDDGYYTVKEEHVIFKAEEGYRDEVYGNGYPQSERVGSTVRYRVIWGNAVEYVEEDNRLVLAIGEELPETIDDVDEDETTSIYSSWYTNAKVVLVEMDEDGDIADINTDVDTSEIEAMSFLDGGVGDEVFIHMTTASRVSLIVIVKR